nr:MAG TPA: hypothetical protein [Caudoviricetes sp.]
MRLSIFDILINSPLANGVRKGFLIQSEYS